MSDIDGDRELEHEDPYLKVRLEDPTQEQVIEELREKLAKAGFGVTVVGQYLTIRWSKRKTGPLREVAMVILAAEDGTWFEEYLKSQKR